MRWAHVIARRPGGIIGAYHAMSSTHPSFAALLSGRLTAARSRLRSAEVAARGGPGRDLGRESGSHDLERLNRHATAFNAEGDDSAAYQAHWDTDDV